MTEKKQLRQRELIGQRIGSTVGRRECPGEAEERADDENEKNPWID